MSQNGPAWNVKAVVFDLDGLLIDTEPIFAEASRRMLARRQLSFEPPIIQAMMGMPALRALAIFREYYRLPESVDELMKESSAVFYEVLGQEPAPLMLGVLPLLARL